MFEDYDIVIGLEVHAELKTKTKVFCSCKNEFGSEPNSNCCPVCVGLPGALPVLNKKAVELTIKAGHTIGSSISPIAVFERKNYFYPDLAKAYQISQLERPICVGGSITLDSGKVIRINRIHLEEDAGKLVHKNDKIGTLIDYNRGGVPLIEMVTEPDISSAEEAVEFLMKYRSNLVFGDIADCKMEQGGMRCDVNLSVKKKGSSVLGTRTEMKNLNSFKMVQRAIEFEARRQVEEIEAGKTIVQETRKWDDNRGRSFAMRSKEEAQDYRYFPDPDILSVEISEDVVNSIKKTLPELSHQKKLRYIEELGLPAYDAKILTSEKYICEYFEKVLDKVKNPKIVSNWVMTEVLAKCKEQAVESLEEVISVKNLAYIINAVQDKEITRINGKELFEDACYSEFDAEEEAKSRGMVVKMSDQDLEKFIGEVMEENRSAVADYKDNPVKVENFFIGSLMKKTQGKANVEKARPIIHELLERSVR
ncbi:MAG: Asp-tRNA(Asn)/Glu-tRNA(Gln) amidotransferase subunit GatB [Clostridia bacterium]|nr:Asp-tRNA(Asn)/Glu-tRNA(Gln) amidotransferase subunit GatB [Clostridia bacterium]